MRNIRKFETFEDFLASQESVSGSGEYVEDIVPGFAYIKEIFEETGKGVVYNKVNGGDEGEDYEFGDVIYYDGTNKLKKVYYSAFTPDMGEKVGLVVVPTALSPDGNARMVAFGSVTAEYTPEPGPKSGNDSTMYEPVEARWTNDLIDENQTYYNSVPAFYYSGETISGDGGSTYKASKPTKSEPVERYENVECADINGSRYSSDVLSWGMPNPYTEGEYYIPKTGMMVVSPFLDNNLNTQDVSYTQEYLAGGSIGPIGPITPVQAVSPNLKATDPLIGGSNYNTFHDFSGYTWTYDCPPEYNGGDVQVSSTNPETTLKSNKPVPSPQTGAYFPHNYAREFYTDGTQSGDWYLPSAGEMGFLAARFNMVANVIMEYLYDVGALDENGLDNLSLGNRVFYTSTVIENKSEISLNETIAASSVPGSNVGNNGVYPMLLELDMSQQDKPYIGFFSQSMASGSGEILPFAMIKDGEIQHEQGDYELANGHQIKDLIKSTEEPDR